MSIALAVTLAADWLERRGVMLGGKDWRGIYSVTRTYAHYLRVIDAAAHDLYRGDMDEGDFVQTMIDVIDEQLRKAWNEGMRANNLDPEQDMEDDWASELQDIIDNEYEFVLDFGSAILEAAELDRVEETPNARWPGMKARAALWADRYNDVVNRSKLATAGAADRLVWVYGDTDHCETCFTLNGIVASAEEWRESGFKPQSPPNNQLECGGWNCQCTLEPTNERRTQGRKETFESLR
jgi:hypothetical protein